VIKAEQDLPGTEGREGRVGGQGGEMTQAMYAHVNKRIKKIAYYSNHCFSSHTHNMNTASTTFYGILYFSSSLGFYDTTSCDTFGPHTWKSDCVTHRRCIA
jgi:hypothetical protein